VSERLTDEQLRELDERLRQAGPGEAVRVSSEEMEAICRGNAMFPNLIDELAALRARVAKLEALLQEYVSGESYYELEARARAALEDAP
jgi:hypothetical protein